jgi:hypothetical protein
VAGLEPKGLLRAEAARWHLGSEPVRGVIQLGACVSQQQTVCRRLSGVLLSRHIEEPLHPCQGRAAK